MLKTYFKIAWRQLKKNRLFGTVNIVGLAIGLTISLLLFLYVRHESSFDNYHSKGKNIYRLVFNARLDGVAERWAGNPNIVGPTFKQELSEVRDMTRWIRHNFGESANFLYGDKKFFEKNLYWADSSITTIFDIPFVHGNPATALTRPKTIIINETLAKKYFGNENPVGKVVKLDNKLDCEITGVFKDFPGNSTLDADLIGSISPLFVRY
jgi:putative ABC transport system permease protein